MTNDKFQLLNVRRPPGRLNTEDAGVYLGFAVHEMRLLMAAGLISPLGSPLPSGVKYFSSSEIERLRCDVSWLTKASDCIASAWQLKNQKSREKEELQQKAKTSSESTPAKHAQNRTRS
jgi:hypothetical protein